MTNRIASSLHRSKAQLILTAAWIAIAAPVALGQGIAPPPAPPSAAPAPPVASTSVPAKPIEFDVAVFKLNKSGSYDHPFTIPADGDGFTFANRPMHDLIRYAFSKGRGGSFRISGQPSWVDDDHYDVQAKVAPEDIAEWQRLDGNGKRLALQGFVIEYLKLKYHPDPTPYPYYALVVGKNGPKFRESKPGDSFKTPDGKSVAGRVVGFTGPDEITVQDAPIEQFADMLTGYADRPVIDKTGLAGVYSFVVHFDPEPDPGSPGGATPPFYALRPDAATPVIFSAVKQLGLQLVFTKGPIDAIVIDHVERPPDN